VNAAAIRYLNRLSDALFVMARETNRRAGVPDVTWKPAAPPKKGRAK
jgi:cob(I)alamin adenosyltransferase